MVYFPRPSHHRFNLFTPLIDSDGSQRCMALCKWLDYTGEYWLWKPFIVPSSHGASCKPISASGAIFYAHNHKKADKRNYAHRSKHTPAQPVSLAAGKAGFLSSRPGAGLSNPSVREGKKKKKKQSQPFFSKSHIIKVITRPAGPHLRPLKKMLTPHTLLFLAQFFKRPLRTELDVEASMAFL